MKKSFGKIIISYVSLIYIVFITFLFIIFNNIYFDNIKKKYLEENAYAAQVVQKTIEEEKSKAGANATIVSRDKGLRISIAEKIDLYVSVISADSSKTDIKEMSTSGYMRMLSSIQRGLNSSVVSGENEIELFDTNLNLISRTAGIAKDKIDNPEDEYMAPLKEGKRIDLGVDSFGVVALKGNDFFFKGIRSVYYDTEIGLIGTVIISKPIDQTMMLKFKSLTNKEIILVKDNQVLLSTIYRKEGKKNEEKINISREELQNKEIFKKVIKINGKKMFLEMIPILSYKGNILGYIGVGFDSSVLDKIYLLNTLKYILFAILFSVIGFVILRAILKKLFLPFNSIIYGLDFIKQGDYNAKLKVESGEELEILANAINNLSEEIKKREENLITLNKEMAIKNEQLMDLDKTKDDFLANTSHELKTPLNGIIGLAESLADGATGDLHENTKYNLMMIVNSGKRLVNLINDILDFSRLKNKDIVLAKEPVDMYQVTEIVVYLSKPLLRNTKIEIQNNIKKDVAKIDADNDRIKQIMHNLIGNAIKYTDRGKITISANQKGNMLEISVADTGIGIETDKIGEIFQSFGRIESSTGKKQEGTGLGLSISKKMVELHGGELTVESQKGKGSIFKFTIPLAEEQEKIPLSSKEIDKEEFENFETGENRLIEPISIVSNEKIDYRILIVDDEIVNIQILINYFSIEGYIAETAYNGMEALEKIENNKYDLVLLDIMMPVMNGYRVCENIRKKYSQIELPVLMLTAKTQTKDIVAGFEAGANDYLTKPFEKEEILSRVKGLVSLKRMKDEAVKVFSKYEIEKQKRILSEKLNEFSTLLNSKIEFTKIIEQLIGTIERIIPFYKAEVFIKNNEDYKLIYSNLSFEKDISLNIQENPIFKEITEKKLYTSVFYPKFKWSQIGENINFCLGIPMMYNDEVMGIILLENKVAEDYNSDSIDLIYNFISQAVIAIENVNLFKEVKIKNRKLEENIKRLQAIEKLTTVIYTENDMDRIIDHIFAALMLGLGFNYNIMFYFEYDEENKKLVKRNYFEVNKKQKLETVDIIDEDYQNTIATLEMILGNRKYRDLPAFEIDLSKEDEIADLFLENKSIIFYDKKVGGVGICEWTGAERTFIAPVSYSGKYYGGIGIDIGERKLSNDDMDLIYIFTNNFSLFMDKRKLERDKLELERESSFRCVKCNRKLMNYKGKADFLEIKCPYCNTINTMKNE